MKVDTTTLLFQDLTEQEAADLQQLAEGIILAGKVPAREDPFVTAWVAALCTKLGQTAEELDRAWLLTVSTVFPARALLSVVRYLQAIVTSTYYDQSSPFGMHD